MDIDQKLAESFDRFLAHDVSDDLLREISSSVSIDDVDRLIASVQSLDDPSEYCRDDLDEKTPAGFFLYVDFVSALIISLGDSATRRAIQFEDSNHPFVRWVVRYVGDDRFHKELISKFADVIE